MVSRFYAVNLNKQTSHDIIKDNAEAFEWLGFLEGEYKIRTDESICPVVHPPRKVPFSIKPKIKEELDCMRKLNVMEKVNQLTKKLGQCNGCGREKGQS